MTESSIRGVLSRCQSCEMLFLSPDHPSPLFARCYSNVTLARQCTFLLCRAALLKHRFVHLRLFLDPRLTKVSHTHFKWWRSGELISLRKTGKEAPNSRGRRSWAARAQEVPGLGPPGETSQHRRFLHRRIEEWSAKGRRASTVCITVAELK